MHSQFLIEFRVVDMPCRALRPILQDILDLDTDDIKELRLPRLYEKRFLILCKDQVHRVIQYTNKDSQSLYS